MIKISSRLLGLMGIGGVRECYQCGATDYYFLVDSKLPGSCSLFMFRLYLILACIIMDSRFHSNLANSASSCVLCTVWGVCSPLSPHHSHSPSED